MAEHIRKPDRRTQRTRQLLRDALMELIVEKGAYDAVSIQDITDHADVARTTFYLHYRDKDELLLTGMAEMYDELVSDHPDIKSSLDLSTFNTAAPIDASDYHHVHQFAEFYRVMLSNKGSLTFILGVLRYLESFTATKLLDPDQWGKQSSRLPPGLVANMLGWAEAGAMDWWLREGSQYSAEEMAQMQSQMCMFGLSWALRLDVHPPEDVTS